MPARATIRLAIDAMSGDHGHIPAVGGALMALRAFADLQLTLVGDEPILRSEVRRLRAQHDGRLAGRLFYRQASEVVQMDELPSKTLRNKKDSSMRVALDCVHNGDADAAVSAGNTGALMATAKFVLKTLPGIDRPAIMSAIPSVHGHVHMLDLGANTECTAEQLVQFAVMGSALVSANLGIERPKVALLNIGEEEIKGHDSIRQAARMLGESSLNYVGFVEGDGIFLRDIDVVVCDGFTGNVALKTGEGVARMVYHFMRQEFTRNLLTRLAAAMALPALKALGRRMDPRNYNGASLVGVNGIVVKSHGGADAKAFAAAIGVARREVLQEVPEQISRLLARTALERSAPSLIAARDSR